MQIQIVDIGVWNVKQEAEKRERLSEVQIAFLLMGGREWEAGRAVWALEHWPLPKKPVILMEFGLTSAAERILKEQKIQRFYKIPFFQNIWKPEKKAALFYEKLWRW